MKRLMLCAALVCLGTMVLASQGQGKGKSKPPKEKEQGTAAVTMPASGTAVNANLRFGLDDTRIIHDYYRPKVQQLPPGLQKKVARGGTLPPGWQKKVQPFPIELDRRLALMPTGYRRVVSGPVAMLIHDATNTVLDIIELAR